MECERDYASAFLHYLSDFVANIRPDDPLPVRAPSYKVTENEIDGQILDIVHHYLNSRECPPYVREHVGHQVWTAIRNPALNGGEDEVDSPATNTTYDPMKLIQEVTAKANTVIREMQASLTVEEVEKLPRYHPISHFAIKNTRRKMEDRHVIIPDLNTLYGMKYGSPHAYYGVFDGHAGTDAAVYSAAHLHQYMIQNPQYDIDPIAALKHAFHITDTNFIKKSSKERLKGGTTAVVALVREKRLVVAWLGDSQALLVRRRNPVRMVEPHKPELPVERERVEELGGCVINIQGTWRVLGQLAVSRAIGDVDYKPFVTSECDIKSLEIEGDEDFLILACDGLWDTLTPEAAVNVVYAYLTHNDGDTDGVGRCLVEAARNSGSEDNITAVVVFLRPVATLMEEEATRVAQGLVPEPVPTSLVNKDMTPSSINAIFSPPINQFECNTPPTPAFNPFDDDSPAQPHIFTPSSLQFQMPCEPMEGSEAPRVQDSDDEGVAGARANIHDAPTPTAEEVDAALAELDSIPDGVCESGDVEEEEDEEEEWSYFRMEPQTQPQGEDILMPGGTVTTAASGEVTEDVCAMETMEENQQDLLADTMETSIQPPLLENAPDILQASIEKSFDVETTSAKSFDLMQTSMDQMQTSMDKIPDLMDGNFEPSSPQGSVSPHVPGSPRSVEGFVTSVELNTPEESFATNFNINQNQDTVTSGVEQASGPFSVYVSSSPEPSSLEATQAAVDLVNLNGVPNGQVEEEDQKTTQFDVESPVEIVHAQSTVEVVAPPSPVEVTGPETQFLPSQVTDEPADLTFVPEKAVEPMIEVPEPVYVDEHTPVSESDAVIDLLGDMDINKDVEQILTPETASVPTEAVIPTEPLASPVSTPVEPVSTPVEPVSTPVEPVSTPVEPFMAPVSPVQAPVEPTMSPAEPALSPVEPTISPAEPAPSPIEPTIAPAEPETTPIESTLPELVEQKSPDIESDKVSVELPKISVTAKAPAKTAKTPARATPDKKPTQARATPGRATPGRVTPAKTAASPKPSPRLTTAKPAVAKTGDKVSTTKTMADKPKTTKTAPVKPTTARPTSARPTPSTTKPATARPTATRPPARKPAEKTATAPVGRTPGSSTTGAARTATTRPTPATRTTSAARTTASTSTAKTTTSSTTARTTTARKPLSTTTKTTSSNLVNGSTTRPAATTTRKPLSQTTSRPASTRPAAEKETKNTTNRILSTRTAAKTATATATSKTAVSKTSTTARSSTNAESRTTRVGIAAKAKTTTATRTTATKMTGVATKTGVSKTKITETKLTAAKSEKEVASVESNELVVNGENKIADEETSVEVIEKCAVEDIMMTSSEKVVSESSETVTTTEQIMNAETTEIIVNGDH